jgi:hypothetical protein
VPDLDAMNKAIEKHVSEHENKNIITKNKNMGLSDRIRETLIAQVFEKACK